MKKLLAASVAMLCVVAVCAETRADHRSSRNRSSFGFSINTGRGVSLSFGRGSYYSSPYRSQSYYSGGLPFSSRSHSHLYYVPQQRVYVTPHYGHYHYQCF